jgi:hypothetical protein
MSLQKHLASEIGGSLCTGTLCYTINTLPDLALALPTKLSHRTNVTPVSNLTRLQPEQEILYSIIVQKIRVTKRSACPKRSCRQSLYSRRHSLFGKNVVANTVILISLSYTSCGIGISHIYSSWEQSRLYLSRSHLSCL